jgi:deoxyribodipyrimidine photo-lyase
VSFLFDGLRRLDEDLQAIGSQLIVRHGQPLTELRRMMAEVGAGAIFAEEDFSPYARRRDAQIGRELNLKLFAGLTVYPPEAILKEDGTAYTVFTPYSRQWKRMPPVSVRDILATPARMAALPLLFSEPISRVPAIKPRVSFVAGEAEGQRRLKAFSQGVWAPIYQYEEGRNLMGSDGTSQLSPYLRFGMISARQAVVAAYEARQAAPGSRAASSAETWLNELIWREFYASILYHFPQVRSQSFRPALQNIIWENDVTQFDRWCLGLTGYPVVDAAMRQLTETGWMHNRGRMITASFLVKHLLIDWRWGERWFMQKLVDGDPAANNGGWQWTAGTGTDAAPYFRVFNPILQGKKFDKEGSYVRRWVPELARVPLKYLHAPWEMPGEIQRQIGCLIGRDYPGPAVDHAAARERALRAYRAASAK